MKFAENTSEVSGIPEGVETMVADQSHSKREKWGLHKLSINQGNLGIFVRKLGQHSPLS